MKTRFHLEIYSLSDSEKNLIEKPPKSQIQEKSEFISHDHQHPIKSLIKVSSEEQFSFENQLSARILEFLLKQRKTDVIFFQISNK